MDQARYEVWDYLKVSTTHTKIVKSYYQSGQIKSMYKSGQIKENIKLSWTSKFSEVYYFPKF